jgi:hypothetical protein
MSSVDDADWNEVPFPEWAGELSLVAPSLRVRENAVRLPSLASPHLINGAFRCFPGKKKGSHGGHGVHGGVDRYRACGSACFLSFGATPFKNRVQPIDQWLKVSVSPWTPCELSSPGRLYPRGTGSNVQTPEGTSAAPCQRTSLVPYRSW